MPVFKIIFVLALTPLLSGCLISSFIKDVFSSPADSMNIESDLYGHSRVDIKDLRIPEPGEKVQITDPETKREITVTFGKAYTSASGKLCSPFSFNRNNDSKTTNGVACLNDEKEWKKNPLDIRITNGINPQPD